MAYFRKRPDGRIEIRESVATATGPRARTLVVFRGPLRPDLLERAASRARRPFDRAVLLGRAAALGIAVTRRRASAAARALLTELRDGVAPDPRLAALLAQELARCPAAPVADGLADVAAWVGVGAVRRGLALRGLLRASDRLVRARPPRRTRRRAPFPRLRSRPARGSTARA